jgi:predicted transcriptional regulator
VRAWKGMAWEVMDRLYEKGYISDPKNKNKSVYLTEEGQKLSEELFWRYFSK